jgi:hypothetical protein
VAPRLIVFQVLQVIPAVIIPPTLHIHLLMSGDPLDVAAPQTSRAIRIKKKSHLGEGKYPAFPLSA